MINESVGLARHSTMDRSRGPVQRRLGPVYVRLALLRASHRFAGLARLVERENLDGRSHAMRLFGLLHLLCSNTHCPSARCSIESRYTGLLYLAPARTGKPVSRRD